MKNKQTILYTLLGIMFGIVIGMITISSASAVDMQADPYGQVTSCHEEKKECEEGKDCKCVLAKSTCTESQSCGM